MKPRILLADDHPLILEGFQRLLLPAYEIVSLVGNGRELVKQVLERKPDIAILDFSMPLLNGLEAMRQARRENATTKFLFVSMYAEASYVRAVLRAGGSGYILKRSATSELVKALEEVLKGNFYVSPQITTEPVHSLMRGGPGSFGSKLTARQREVLQLVAEGRSSKEIAAVLNISLKTVEFHRNQIMQSLGLHSTAELTRYAVERGIVGR